MKSKCVGTLESLVPVWGSGKQAYLDFKNGRYFWGWFNVALAITDVTLAYGLGKTICKVGWEGLFKAAGSHSHQATLQWMKKKGYPMSARKEWHHWALRQGGWGKRIPRAVKNQPWNLMKMSRARHMAVHGQGRYALDGLGRIANGTPQWSHRVTTSATGRFAHAGRSRSIRHEA